MATTIANFNHQYLFEAADTYNYTIVNAGTKRITVRLTDVTNVGGITITIKKNSTTLSTTTGNAAFGRVSATAMANYAASDTLTVIIASSAASDSAPNQIKGTIDISSLTGGEG